MFVQHSESKLEDLFERWYLPSSVCCMLRWKTGKKALGHSGHCCSLVCARNLNTSLEILGGNTAEEDPGFRHRKNWFFWSIFWFPLEGAVTPSTAVSPFCRNFRQLCWQAHLLIQACLLHRMRFPGLEILCPRLFVSPWQLLIFCVASAEVAEGWLTFGNFCWRWDPNCQVPCSECAVPRETLSWINHGVYLQFYQELFIQLAVVL